MNPMHALLVAAACASLTPLLTIEGPQAATAKSTRVAWPTHFQGRLITKLPLSERERAFLAEFPGSTARFTDGGNDIVMRLVQEPTRRLHPAEDCYRSIGYEIAESRIVRDIDQAQWRCFTARRNDGVREVCEHLQDKEGRRWTDVSSWYWAATLGQSQGPWLVVTVAQ